MTPPRTLAIPVEHARRLYELLTRDNYINEARALGVLLVIDQNKPTIGVALSERDRTELQHLVDESKLDDLMPNFETVEDLGAHVLAHIADGSRRPGSWERQLLYQLGLMT